MRTDVGFKQTARLWEYIPAEQQSWQQRRVMCKQGEENQQGGGPGVNRELSLSKGSPREDSTEPPEIRRA